MPSEILGESLWDSVVIGPCFGCKRPLKGLIRPFKGLIRPLKGLIRPFKGLIRPFNGGGAILRTF